MNKYLTHFSCFEPGRMLIFSILLTFSALAYAQPRGSDIVTNAYSQTYRVSVTEAARRLSLIQQAGRLERRLQLELPDTFAGLYIEHHPEFRVVVKFTSDAQARLATYTRDPEFVAETSPRSLEILLATQEELGEQLRSAGVQFESGLDIRNSEINVFVLDPVVVSKRVSTLLSVANFVNVRKTVGFIEITDIAGGNQLAGTQQICTSGFNVVEPVTRELGISTAAHCDDNVSYTSPAAALVFQGEQNAGSYDVQWHKQPTSGTPQKQLNEITVPGGSVKITSETSSSGLPIGAMVCKSGITTGNTCGEVADKNSQSLYNGEIGTYIRVHNVNGQVMTEGGDSGGPVFGSDTAYGLVHGRGGSGTATHDDMYFMPIENISSLGISVLTKKFKVENIPSVSGSPSSIPVNINFSGYPRFPVDATVEIVTCPDGWACTGGTTQYTSNIPSPLSYNWGCNPGTSSLPVVFTVRTMLKDASGINPPAIEHTITCTAAASLMGSSIPGASPKVGLEPH